MSYIGDLENKVWTTREGTDIPVSKMEFSHLLNCVNFLQKRIKEGKTTIIKEYGGMGSDNMDIWYDWDEVDVKEEMEEWIKVFHAEMKARNRKEIHRPNKNHKHNWKPFETIKHDYGFDVKIWVVFTCKCGISKKEISV